MAFAGHEETSRFGGWESLSLSGGYVQGRGDGIAPSAVYIGGPDYQIGRENVGGQLVPMDEPLREVGTDLVPVRSPMEREGTPSPPLPTVPVKQLDPIPASPTAQSARPKKRRPQQTEKSSAQVAESQPSQVPEKSAPVATPKAETQVAETSIRESAKEFASGFGKGVRDEGERIYRDAKELPDRIAKSGREFVEDLKEGRRLRALAPIEAIGHAIQNASSDDVERLAHGVIDSARDFYHKPAKEKGESIGRATMSIASDAAISALTDGLGTVASLRKAEKAAEAAEHVRDAERMATAAMKDRPTRFVSGAIVTDRRTGTVLEGTVDLRPTLDRIESGVRYPHRNDGAVFQNHPLPGRDKPSIPNQSPGYYREYVHPTPGTHGPGPQRVVIGKGGEMYYTPDHYQTFVALK